jgi:hypothetical protein
MRRKRGKEMWKREVPKRGERKKYKGNKERVRKIEERTVHVLSIKRTGSGLFLSLLCAE